MADDPIHKDFSGPSEPLVEDRPKAQVGDEVGGD